MICRLLALFLDPLCQVEKYKQGDSVLSPYHAKIEFFNYPGAEGVNGFSQGLLATAAVRLPAC